MQHLRRIEFTNRKVMKSLAGDFLLGFSGFDGLSLKPGARLSGNLEPLQIEQIVAHMEALLMKEKKPDCSISIGTRLRRDAIVLTVKKAGVTTVRVKSIRKPDAANVPMVSDKPKPRGGRGVRR